MQHEGKLIGVSMKTDENFSWEVYDYCKQGIGKIDAIIEVKEGKFSAAIRKLCVTLRCWLAAVVMAILFCSMSLLHGKYEAITSKTFALMCVMLAVMFSAIYIAEAFIGYDMRYDKTRPRKYYIIGYLLGLIVGGIIFAIDFEGLSQFTVDATFGFVSHIVMAIVFLRLFSELGLAVWEGYKENGRE